MEILLLMVLGTAVTTLALQALLLRLTRNRLRPLRWALLGLLSVPVCGMVDEWRTGGFLWELGVAVWAAIALCGLIGWAMAWPLAASGRKRERP